MACNCGKSTKARTNYIVTKKDGTKVGPYASATEAAAAASRYPGATYRAQ